MSLFQNQNKQKSGGLFSGGGQQGGGLLGGGQQQQGSLFSQGGQQQKSGGLLGGGQQQQGGLLGGGQQQGSGSGLFGNQQKTGTGQQGGLFSQGSGTGSGGGLFNQQNKSGGSLLGGGGSGGGLFSGQGSGSGGSYSLLSGQKPGGQTGGLFSGTSTTGTHFPDLSMASTKTNRYQLSLTNPVRDRKVGTLTDKHKQFIELVAKTLGNNQSKIEGLKLENLEIVKKKDMLADAVYQFSQDGKQLYMKIKQARYLVDDMKSNLSTYEEITSRNFDVSLDLLKGGRLPRIDIPSAFMTNITEFFDLRIRELKDKIGEIEELVKISDINEDNEEYEKIIMVLDELYNYYLNVAHKVFQVNEYVTTFKAQFIDYFKSQGSREVERIFLKRSTDAYKSDIDILGKLEGISNNVLDNKMKKKEQEDANKIQKKRY